MKTGMVVGTAGPHSWSQVSVSPHREGQVVVVLTLAYTGDSELVDLAAIGGSLLEAIKEKAHITPEELSDVSSDIHISAVLLIRRENDLKVIGIGGTSVYLHRQGKIGRIFQGGTELTSMEGELKTDDTLLVVTQAIEKTFPLPELHKILSAGVEATENLAVMVHGQADSSMMAAVVGEVEPPEEGIIADDEVPTNRLVPLTKFTDAKDSLVTFLSKIRAAKPLFISQEKKSRNLWIGSVLIVLLILGVLSGLVRRTKLVKIHAFDQLNSSVTQKITEARSVGDLNPERAKLLLKQGAEEIDAYKKKTEDTQFLARAQQLSQNIAATETEVFKKKNVTITTLIDLAVLNKNLSSEKMFIDESGNILIPDSGANRVNGVNVDDKSDFEINTDSVGTLGELGSYGKKIFGNAQSGVAQIATKETKIVIEPDDLWKQITLLDVFAGNVYLFDKGQSEIWKYPVLTDGFGARRRWLAAGIAPDLSNVIDMKVDGDVWILTSTGKLERYSRGVPVTFSMEGFPASDDDHLLDPRAIFLKDNEVYVLEAGAKRVVVFNEDSGTYEKQYAADEFGEARDLVVFKDKGYVLLKDKIVWFQL